MLNLMWGLAFLWATAVAALNVESAATALPPKPTLDGVVWEPRSDIVKATPTGPAVGEPVGEYEILEPTTIPLPTVITPLPTATPVNASYEVIGQAHWYGPGWAGLTMANGEKYDPSRLTIATHLPIELDATVFISSPCGSTYAVVTDRMAYDEKTIVDLSDAVAGEVMCAGYGVARSGKSFGSQDVSVLVVESVAAIEDYDVNDDGVVDVLDALQATDVNHDGVVNSVDAQLILSRWGDRPGTKLAYEGRLREDVGPTLGEDGHDFWWRVDFPGQWPKVNYASDFNYVDPYGVGECQVAFEGGHELSALRAEVRDHNPRVVIVGEEPNLAVDEEHCPDPRFCGRACCGEWGCYLKPREFARFYHAVVAEVLAGWSDAGVLPGTIVGPYFAQDDVPSQLVGCAIGGHVESTAEYLNEFLDEYALRWPNEVPPINAVVYNHHPACSILGEESTYGSAAKSIAYWTGKRLELANQVPYAEFWVESTWGRLNDGACGAAKRLLAIRSWGGAKRLLWFQTLYEPWLYPAFRTSALYDPDNPLELSVVGEAFRDKTLPASCQ